MTTENFERKLAAIFYADVAGYSRLTGADEEGTHRRLSEYLDVISAAIKNHRGRVVHYAGDAVLADFSTVTDALSCAAAIQEDLANRNRDLSKERQVQFRIGVNLGEVIVDRDDIYGDGVNVAARLESLADPGGICISGAVYDAIGNKLPALHYAFMGEQSVKNIAKPVRAYRVMMAAESAQAPPACPYPGMVPFSAAEARYFYGRDEDITRMVQLLRRQRFLMVIGPSGSGKSSLVYAGLLPALEQSRYFKAGYWLIRTMRPGPRPSEVLAGVIGADGDSGTFEPGSVDVLLKSSPPAERLLLLVDQFEEIFTQAGREERAHFIAELQALRAPENCALILTLRADFYPDLMTSYLWPVDASQRVEVAPLRGEALRTAIEKPAADVGVRIEENLVNQLLADAADEPGVLPLLQETMGLLWQEMEQRTLTYSAYRQLSEHAGLGDSGAFSGLAVAIAMKADATLAELSLAQQAIARRIFLRLIQFGEGRADTRRQQPVAALRTATDEPEAFEQTLEHLTDHRLLTRSGGEGGQPPAVDIAHESLINGWSRLQHWADERREAEQIRRRLEGKAAEWVRLGKGSGGLLDEAELPEAERWLTSPDATDLGYGATLPELVTASQQAIDAAEQALEAARQQELRQSEALAEEQRQRIGEQTRAAKRMRRSLVGLAAVFLVAVAAALFAWTQSRQAQLQSQKAQALAQQEAVARTQSEQRRIEAENAHLTSIAQLLSIQAPQQQALLLDERGALLARQAYRFSAAGSRRLQEQVDGVLRTVVSKPYFSPILRRSGTSAVSFSPDGTTLASTHIEPDMVLLWNLTKPGTPPVRLSGYPGDRVPGTTLALAGLYALAFSPDGKTLIAGNADGTIGRWNLQTPQVPFVALPRQKGGVWSAAFSPDGHWLALGSKLDDTFTLWDLTRPTTEPRLIQDPEPAVAGSGPGIERSGGVSVAFSPDSTLLATGSLNGIIRLWHPDDISSPIASLRGHQGDIPALTFHPDGKRLVSSGQDASIRLWNVEDPSAAPLQLSSGSDPVTSLDFDHDGNTLAASSANSFRLWRIDTPQAPPVVVTTGNFYQVAFSPDGKLLATGGTGSSFLRIWDRQGSSRQLVLTGHQGSVTALAFSPDMTLLASGGGRGDKTIRLWHWGALDAPPQILRSHEGDVGSLQFSADSQQLLSASWDSNSIWLWDLSVLPPAFTALPVPDGFDPWTALISPDGSTIVTNSLSGAYAWDLAHLAAAPRLLQPLNNWGTELAVSPNSAFLAIASRNKDIYLKDFMHPGQPAAVLRGHSGRGAWSVAFSPDGKRLASGGDTDAAVRLWNPAIPDAPSIVLGRHDEAVTRVRFSPNGKQLASVSLDYGVRLWQPDQPDALPIVLSGHEGEIWALAYSPDGRYLVTGGRDKTIRIWDLTHPLNSATTKEIADMVCTKVWRNLTLEEWQKFIGEDIPYERTCPNLPIDPGLFETAEKLARAGDKAAALALLERALELDPDLDLKPQEQVESWLQSTER